VWCEWLFYEEENGKGKYPLQGNGCFTADLERLRDTHQLHPLAGSSQFFNENMQ
jgi:hypothetical protein